MMIARILKVARNFPMAGTNAEAHAMAEYAVEMRNV
jgi:hypothetical protein